MGKDVADKQNNIRATIQRLELLRCGLRDSMHAARAVVTANRSARMKWRIQYITAARKYDATARTVHESMDLTRLRRQ